MAKWGARHAGSRRQFETIDGVLEAARSATTIKGGTPVTATETLADTSERAEIRDAVRAVCDRFDDDYWAERDRTHSFPFEFAQAIAEGGWLGIAMPEEFGGAGFGVTEAAIMMQEVGRSAGAFAACSTIHINIFGLHSIVKHGTDAQRRAWLPTIIEARRAPASALPSPMQASIQVKIKTRAVRKGDRYVVTRPENLDQHGAAGRQDRAARAHHADRGMRQADRRTCPCSTPTSTAPSRDPRDPEDGPPCRQLQSDLLSTGSTFRSNDRIGEEGKGLSLYSRQPQSGAHPQRRRGRRHGAARAGKGRRLCR